MLLCEVPTAATISCTHTSRPPITQRILSRSGWEIAFSARAACSMCSSLSMRVVRTDTFANRNNYNVIYDYRTKSGDEEAPCLALAYQPGTPAKVAGLARRKRVRCLPLTRNLLRRAHRPPPPGSAQTGEHRAQNPKPLLCFIACGIALLSGSSLATDGRPSGNERDVASTGQVAERQGDLRQLRNQIDVLRREVAAAEGSRKDAADQLQESERAISLAHRELRTLATEIARIKGVLKSLESESRELEQRLGTQQRQLEKLLYRQYLRGRPDPLRLLLSGEDPNQAARDLHYLEAVGRARGQILTEIETTLKEIQSLASDNRHQSEQLAAAESRRRDEHARLLAEREQRQAVLKSVSEQISTQRREIGNLQRDEKRLSELVERLARFLAARATENREAQRRESLRRGARQESATASISPPGDPLSAARAPAVTKDTPREQPSASEGLAQQRGQLHVPASGLLSNRFGTTRQEGSAWKGVFIRAQTGSDVRSIAHGRVVFAEWMRGFGNLLIVDHGHNYLSIYANNEALLKQVGDEVHHGEAIATVGNSGGNPESGLYFEIRHQGKPLDPQAWLNLK